MMIIILGALLFLALSTTVWLWVALSKRKDVLLSMREHIVQLQTELAYEKQHTQDKEHNLQQSQQHFQILMESLTQKALIQNNESFLKLAQGTLHEMHERAKVDIDHKQENINKLIQPLQQSLEKVDLKMEALEKERAHAFTDLRRQVVDLMATQKELRFETANLVKALRTPTGRGQWGEMQLKRVIEMAGMLSHCDFMEQNVVADGKLRPDVIVRLPGNKTIVIDAKTPLMAYLESLETQDDQQKQGFLIQHARHVKTHIAALSKRQYFEQFEHSPEFVVMFMPGESIFSAALQADPTLIEYGVQEKVILATPTTLIALLRAVAYGWQQEAVAENARQIGQLGKEFFKRLMDYTSHMNKVGKHLNQAVDSYNDSIGSFEKRVLVSARKFKELDPGIDTVENEVVSIEQHTKMISNNG